MPWEKTENEIRHRLHDPDNYSECKSKNITAGVRMIYCKKKNQDDWEAQALRFDKEKFTLAEAKAWLKDHKDSFSEVKSDNNDPKEIIMKVNQYAEIEGLEIFKAGTAESKEYSATDLDNMVSNLGAGGHDAPVVISHDENQNLLKASGLLAAGWVKKLYRQGMSLFADLRDVPAVVADLIKKKAIAKRSVEIYNDYVDDGGKHFGKVIRRLAFLGGDIPRIKNLSDHLALYGEEEADAQEVKVVSFSEINETIEGELKRHEFDDQKDLFKDTIGAFAEDNNQEQEENTMTPEEQKKIEDAAVQKFAEDFAKIHGKTPEEFAADAATQKLQARKQEIENFCEGLKQQGLAPKITDAFKSLMLKNEKFENFAEGESFDKGLNQLMTDLAAAVKDGSAYVNFAEQGKTDEKTADVDIKKYGEEAVGVELLQKAKAYQAEHKVSFGEAMIAVSQEKPKK